MTRRVALIGGPMYDDVYRLLPDDVEVVVHADHGSLNASVAELLGAGERLDLISTHGKYVPSQSQWLHSLDAVVPRDVLDALAPTAVDLCRFGGSLYAVPRNIDVRVLWWRTDRMQTPPQQWSEVVATGGFGFTGTGSGLFGLFYELVVSAGGAIFDGTTPTMDGPDGVAAVATIVELARGCGGPVADWSYDAVDDALIDGTIDMAAAWPGGTARLRASDVGDRLAPAAYPGGSSYSGAHAWAIPTTCADVDASVDLLVRLCADDAVALDVARGTIPASQTALATVEPTDAVDAQRLAITTETIGTAMLTYPPLERFPEVEDAAWGAISDAIVGSRTASDAASAIQAAAITALAGERS